MSLSVAQECLREVNLAGQSVVIRRVTAASGVPSANPTTNPASTASLLVNGAVIAGVSLVALDASAVTGRLLAGDKLKFAGHSQIYTATNNVTASGNAFAGVGITPALQSGIADNEACTVTYAADQIVKGVARNYRPKEIVGNIRQGDRLLTIAAQGLAQFPRNGDKAQLADGNWYEIIGPVDTAYDGNTPCLHRFTIRG